MPSPGSPHALVLPTSSADDLEEAGRRITASLAGLLETDEYDAVAVVHGLSNSAADAFDLAKQRRPRKAGVLWVTDSDFLEHLSGEGADTLRELLAPRRFRILSFVSIEGRRVTSYLHYARATASHVDLAYVRAAQNELSSEV